MKLKDVRKMIVATKINFIARIGKELKKDSEYERVELDYLGDKDEALKSFIKIYKLENKGMIVEMICPENKDEVSIYGYIK